MLTIPLILLAAGSLPSLITGAPIPSSPLSVAHTEVASSHSLDKRTYNILGGNGKVAEGWPSIDDWWPSFDEMFEANRDTMSQSCAQWNVPNNSDEEIDNIASAIKSVSSSSGVDARFILAIVIQESNGCVRAPTTDNGVINPGLMQSHNGVGSCNNGQVLDPCPAEQITQMIQDGTVGTADGAGLKGCLEQAGGTGATVYYVAARIYNSGSVDASGNLGQGIATHCYASDVANRLSGWHLGPSGCDHNTIGSLKSALTSNFVFSGSSSGSDPEETESTSTTTATTTSTITSTTTATTTVTATEAPSSTESTGPTTTTQPPVSSAPAPTTAPKPPSATSAPAATSSAAPTPSDVPKYPYASSSCEEYYTVESGDYCLKVESEIGVSVAQLRELNPGLKEDCTNLWLGYQYCIKA